MRYLPIAGLLFSLAFSGCQENVPVGFHKRQFNFHPEKGARFSLAGNISLYVPAKYDTLLIWENRNDIGATPTYRFTNSHGCLLQESGFFYTEGSYCKDTLDRLTIRTYQSFGLGFDTLNLDRQVAHWREAVKLRETITFHSAPKREKINGKTFVVYEYGYAERTGKNMSEVVSARTEIKQGPSLWVIEFSFQRQKAECRDFAKNACTTLRSIKIDTVAGAPL